ncbi:hypothetical protein ATY81_01995 [Rhizobium sp. R72]|uniref:hypothetical protein n=1 Tax=unclassified Rhizobium TaxID=2613769 RepID=UPI000B52BD5F|nr:MULTISPECIES: hypothetical protein [unclassified Rhizobium]OWW04772.1 hypothetical protein ATY81_01995 [Rhizobium sp. R72]OWW05829.1 hypothetical protein ATY80_01995 [Rhizobium sp. R711]
MNKMLDPRGIVISSDRLEDCKAYLGSEFQTLVDHALSAGWSLDEVVVALDGLAAEEIAVPARAMTLH